MFIQEAYLDLSLAVLINFFSFEGNSFDDVFNNMLTVLIAIQLIGLPLFIFIYICPNYRNLKKSSFMDRYGSIYDMVDLRHYKRSALLWSIFFLGRRILFAIGAIFLVNYPTFQIHLFIFPTVAVLMMVGLAEPLPTPFENKQEVYNNFTILVLQYCLLCFTEFVPKAETRYNMGYLMILLTIQNIVISLVFIAVPPIRMIRLRIKRCQVRRQYKKKMGIKWSWQEFSFKKWVTQKCKSIKDSLNNDSNAEDGVKKEKS